MPKDQLFAAQVELLMRNLVRGTLMAHMAGLLVVVLLLGDTIRPALLFGWVALMVVLLLLRSWHMQHCLDRRLHRDNVRRVAWLLIAGIGATGLAWSAAYIYVAQVAPLTIQYIFLLVIVLIASLSMGPSVVVREYYIAYLVTSLWPIAWWNLVHYWDYPYNAVMGLMLLLATWVLVLVSNNVYRSYRNMFELNWAHETLAEESSALAQDLSVRNAELNQARSRLTELARIDELTGLFNRRALNERLQSEIRRCARFNTPLSVIMLDVDYFKLYNDNYGHPAGDEVLQRLAHVLLGAADRAGDFVARFGGEEFVLVFPGIDVSSARVVAVRIQEALAHEAIEHKFSLVSDCLTVSQGLACASPDEDISSHALIARADEALYAAKGAGRDCIQAA